ncbi:LuxR C-terminal-related transcriptional regulator [uncultured Microbacterium sp.]|uniref:helix-turn-helix transcriptional regulator n=1 Tax=uncultured Microbacterium sp. TaxID=191216 RepID=UPI0035CB16AB
MTLDVIRAVADAESPEQFAEAALSEIAVLVPSDVISLNEVEPGADRFVFTVHPREFAVPPGSAAVLAEHSTRHPLIEAYERTGDGSATRISDLVTVDQWHANPLYAGFYQPLGVEYQISIGLVAPRPIAVAFALNRGARDFDERDRAVLDLARPHLAQSWRNARDRARMAALLATSAEALDRAGSGVILLSDPPAEVTPGTLLEIYRFFGRPGLDSILPAGVDRWLATQRAGMARRDEALLRPLTATIGVRRLVLRLLPGGDRRPDAVLAQHTDVGLIEPRLGALGLSPREAEVLALVGTGATNAQIASRLHVAPSTVKKHLDAIYRKLGVSGRMRASAAAAEILAHHPDE